MTGSMRIHLAFFIVLIFLFNTSRRKPDEIRFEENYRVLHPVGFSVLCPDGWRSELVDFDEPVSDHRILLSPSEESTRRSAVVISIGKLTARPDLVDFSQLNLKTGTVYENASTEEGAFDDDDRTSVLLVSRIGHAWFGVSVKTRFDIATAKRFGLLVLHSIRNDREED